MNKLLDFHDALRRWEKKERGGLLFGIPLEMMSDKPLFCFLFHELLTIPDEKVIPTKKGSWLPVTHEYIVERALLEYDRSIQEKDALVLLFGDEGMKAHDALGRLFGSRIKIDPSNPESGILVELGFGEEDKIATLSGYHCTVVVFLEHHIHVFSNDRCVYTKRFDLPAQLLYRLFRVDPDISKHDMAATLLLGIVDETTREMWLPKTESLLFQDLVKELLSGFLTEYRLKTFAKEMEDLTRWALLKDFWESSYTGVRFFFQRGRNQ